MRHQSAKPVSPAPGEFLPRGRRPQEADRRSGYDGLRVQNGGKQKIN